MPPAAHSRLGASSAYRWMACPGSVREAAKYPNTSSVFAAEGTAAHALAEHCLNAGKDAAEFEGWVIDAASERTRIVEGDVSGANVFPVDDDMIDAVQTYLDAVRDECGPDDLLMVEHKFHLKTLHESFFGTNDACVYKPAERRLVVFDYKHGRGVPVEVERNKQLMYYGLGAALEEARPLVAIDLVVVQPRCPHRDGPVRRWTTSPVDLLEYAGELVDAARLTEHNDAPLAAGDWCKFCPAAPACPALYQKTLDAAGVEFGANSGEPILPEPEVMSSDRLAELLEHVDTIKTWLKAVETFANDEAKAGRPPTGYKLVASRATRKWKDEDQAKEWLGTYGLDTADMLTEPKLKSPAQIEKVIGRKNKDGIAPLVEAKSSGTQLVPVSDPRPQINASAEEDFA